MHRQIRWNVVDHPLLPPPRILNSFLKGCVTSHETVPYCLQYICYANFQCPSNRCPWSHTIHPLIILMSNVTTEIKAATMALRWVIHFYLWLIVHAAKGIHLGWGVGGYGMSCHYTWIPQTRRNLYTSYVVYQIPAYFISNIWTHFMIQCLFLLLHEFWHC